MQTIQVYAMATPTEMSPPGVTYWKAYESKINLWSVLNKVSTPRPNQPQMLHPGMRIVAAIKGKTYQGYFAGYTNLASQAPMAAIVQEFVHQPWMDEEPKIDGAAKTMWSDKINMMGGQLIPCIHVPVTYYSDSGPVAPAAPFVNPAQGHVPPVPGEIPEPQFPTIPGATAVTPPPTPIMSPPAPVKEKIFKIADKRAKLVGDEIFIEDWVDVEPGRYTLSDLVVDGQTVEPDSFKIKKLDWVKQEDPKEEPAETVPEE